MKSSEALLVFNGLSEYADRSCSYSDEALKLSSDFYEIAEGRKSIDEVIETSEDRLTAALGVDHLRLLHDIPEKTAKEIISKFPEPSSKDVIYYGEDCQSIRTDILSRDVGRCQRCGIPENEHQDRFGTGLHVHHQIPLRKFEDLENANRQSNLTTLCARCHRFVETE
jgi:predicted HNH restriction endonuclease